MKIRRVNLDREKSKSLCRQPSLSPVHSQGEHLVAVVEALEEEDMTLTVVIGKQRLLLRRSFRHADAIDSKNQSSPRSVRSDTVENFSRKGGRLDEVAARPVSE